MKHLFIALICTAIGFSASASDLTPKHNMLATVKTTVKINDSQSEIKASNSKNESLSLFRKQMVFTFHDDCGQQLTVWVSGPSAASFISMYDTALDYAANQMTAGHGCF
ncbi:hypothetical protein [Pedobacter nototheniae]|uniref:hypothetical protein n=1 Tax=Pedobacter nototheniae TaxID=2488994 RepID=UPI00103DC775|nr:hypothetical protein [Pedobacter nototheniae]